MLPAVGALLVIWSWALRGPIAVGMKRTLMVQDSPAPRVTSLPAGWQVSATIWKSPAWVPISGAVAVMVTGPEPMFLTVTVCAALGTPTAWLPKSRLAGVTLSCALIALPVRLTVCTSGEALSRIERVPVFGPPGAAGWKTTPIVQESPGASVARAQVLAKMAKLPLMVGVRTPTGPSRHSSG
ncbi:MAG: hypothetical protein U0232_09670 [Thermomicrobiales bacterium]